MYSSSSYQSESCLTKRKLRMLVVSSFPDGPNVTWYLARELVALGHDVELVIPVEGRLSRQAAQLGMRYHVINIRSSLVAQGFVRKRVIDVCAILALRNLLKRGRFDIVHLNLLRARVIGRLAGMFRGHPPMVSTVHGPDLENPFYRAMERTTNWIEKLTVAVSSDTKNYLAAKGIFDAKVRVINNGLDLDMLDNIKPDPEFAEKLLGPESRPLVGIVAYLYPGVKGHETFLQAARHILDAGKDVRFLVVGGPLYPSDNWYEERLVNYAKELGVQASVTFLGNQQNVIQIMDSLDVLVLPSTVREGFGMALVEAMARRKPVVASRIGGMVDVVEENVNGLLFAPGNAEDLAKAILRILSNREMARQFGINGRRRVEERFSSRAMAKGYERLFLELAAGGGER